MGRVEYSICIADQDVRAPSVVVTDGYIALTWWRISDGVTPLFRESYNALIILTRMLATEIYPQPSPTLAAS